MSRARDTADQINRINSSAADATAITVDSSENVGIGTSSPDDKLHVNGSGAFIRVNRTDGESGITLMYNGSNSTRSNIATQTNGDLRFDTANTERLRILSGGGITFNGDTAAANALSDYEEGTWTPTDYLGNALTLNNGGAAQKYTKIGRQVFLDFDVTGTASTSGSQMRGLPFNAPTSYGNGGNLIQGYATGGMPANTRGHVYNDALYMYDGNTPVSWLNGRRLVGTIVYAI